MDYSALLFGSLMAAFAGEPALAEPGGIGEDYGFFCPTCAAFALYAPLGLRYRNMMVLPLQFIIAYILS